MKLLLTDAGVRNASIHAALLDLLGRPVEECTALCIPTAGYGGADADPFSPWKFVSGRARGPMTGLGWKDVGILELAALPTIDEAIWTSWLREADVLLANGGDAPYLVHHLRASGLADLLPTLTDTVYVGISAGSMAVTRRLGRHFVDPRTPDAADDALGLVDFSLFPHLGLEGSPDHTMEAAERWAATLDGPGYATDPETAIQVVDGAVDVVSEGRWRRFGG